MSDAANKNGCEMMKCPLCEGRGELPKQQLLERLNEKDLGRKVENFMSIVESEEREALHGSSGQAVPRSVTTWNLTHFLWRRSPKE